MPANEPTPTGEIVLYRTDDGSTRIECRFANENIWLTQRLLAELFQVGVNTINHHIKEILADVELTPEATIRNYRIVQTEGARTIQRQVEHYSLDMILAVGYRVRDILTHAGRVEKTVADELAEREYDQFRACRLAQEAGNDAKAFDDAVKKLPAKKPRRKKS